MKDRPVIYEPHPVTPERAQELWDKGYKIIDAIFAPADYVHPDNAKPARQPRKVVSDDSAE